MKALLNLGLAGDVAAYQEFLKTLSPHLRGFFRKRLFHLPEDVEDLVQETLLAVHRQRHTYHPYQPLMAWVHAIAHYKLVDMFRARARCEALNNPLDDEPEISSWPDGEAMDAQHDLDTLLAGLPDRQRLPIVYVKLEGLSVLEAAQRTGMSESAVKVGVHRGLKTLAARIRGES